MSMPIPARKGGVRTSAPITISGRGVTSSSSSKGGRIVGGAMSYGGFEGGMAMSMPAAPIIGSLKAPTNLDKLIPDLHLPESSPDAFSLAEANTERTRQRLVGVSSAPARTWIENAARKPASLAGSSQASTSPTVLGFLESHKKTASASILAAGSSVGSTSAMSVGGRSGSMGVAMDDSVLLGKSRSSALSPQHGTESSVAGAADSLAGLSLKSALQQNQQQPQAQQEGGLSAMLKKGGIGGALSGPAVPSGNAASSSAGLGAALLSSSFGGGGLSGMERGAPVILSASFRDPSAIPVFPAGQTIREGNEDEDEEDEDDDDEEREEGLESSDDEYYARAAGRSSMVHAAPIASAVAPVSAAGGASKGIGGVVGGAGTRGGIGAAIGASAAATGPVSAVPSATAAVPGGGKPPMGPGGVASASATTTAAATAKPPQGAVRQERAGSERDDGIFEGDF